LLLQLAIWRIIFTSQASLDTQGCGDPGTPKANGEGRGGTSSAPAKIWACEELTGEDAFMPIVQSRRRFLASAAVAGAAGVVGGFKSLHAEPAPETPIIRIEKTAGGICTAPMFVVGELLRAEGFAELRYVPVQSADLTKALARGVGRVIVNSALDRPWSQYFCCMLAASTDFVQSYPVATKRVLRAFFKATDLCMTEPEWVARQMVDGGFTARYDYALQTLKDVPYSAGRDYDAEDTIRFYALRLQEAGLIQSSPQTIIASGTDWRFLNELKRELKN
jgi:hypothetical protein